VGITLTAASNLAIVEFPWSPADLEQCEGRIDRIGQKADNITIYYLVGAGTVDESTAELLNEKNKILGQTLDGVEGGLLFNDISEMLIAGILENKNQIVTKVLDNKVADKLFD
jgi:SWI/SNF-related matrix-associated actin-dependent regulator 1 of chromatin subfamily A